EYINLQLTGGVASGNPGNSVTAVFDLSDGDVLDFTTFYLGFGIGINERLFKESELRYSRKK
ncbi:MAG TPA: hypothetical protein PLQ21_04835, partial [Candidatus Kapabacteria bacterium]|nr:hypothetical protein [Candidatus Kapabacteria bacterium]